MTPRLSLNNDHYRRVELTLYALVVDTFINHVALSSSDTTRGKQELGTENSSQNLKVPFSCSQDSMRRHISAFKRQRARLPKRGHQQLLRCFTSCPSNKIFITKEQILGNMLILFLVEMRKLVPMSCVPLI